MELAITVSYCEVLSMPGNNPTLHWRVISMLFEGRVGSLGQTFTSLLLNPLDVLFLFLCESTLGH